ncbi:TPA: pilus assembly protein N-terminal domain-containing protein [Candidatus Galligastranaerophilus faecipullorum]|nr:pilus assembly protein N-terminal domain-containing protein [Candidatus Galligastranaerophilus faecipullorum]
MFGKYCKNLILSFICALVCLGAAAGEGYRDIVPSSIDISAPWENTPTQNYNDAMIVKNAFCDNNEKLYGVIGKSQILNFDTPVKRISIADPDLADIVILSSKQLMVNGKKTGSTSLIFWGDDKKPVFYNLVIRQDVDEFLKAVDYIAPNEDISIIFNDNGAVLSGNVSTTATRTKIKDLAKAYNINLVDMAESATKQVLLEVKVAEVTKDFSRNLGTGISIGNNAKYQQAGGSISGSGAIGDIIPLGKFSRVVVDSGVKYFFSNKAGDIAFELQAAETKGDAQILAEPKLLAIDGEEASFNVGSEVPVPSNMGQYGQIAYEFKKTGVILNFTPTIMEKTGRIKLKLSPEVSEIDRASGVLDTQNAVVIPGFKTRKVETTVELMDGETLVIAGLLNNSSSKTNNQVPFLGDIPVIGVLFKTLEQRKNDTELMIFITPKIVDAVQLENI